MKTLPEIAAVENLSVILNGIRVLENISFQVTAGQMVGIIGPNGAGKTTLLRVLLGLIKPASGKATLFELPPGRLGRERSNIGYMPQSHSFERRFPLSVLDVTSMGLLGPQTLLHRFKRREKEACRSALAAVGALGLAERPFQELSGGEQQRVLLARALVRDPSLLLLDEPNSGLDITAQHLFLELLHSLQEKRGLTVLLVSHDLISVAVYADILICINRIMHVHGNPHEVLHSPDLKEAYRCQFDLLKMAAPRKEILNR